MTTAIRATPMHIAIGGKVTGIDLEPLQGLWSVEQYLKLTDHTRYLVEFTDGNIEVLPMPTQQHQLILAFSTAPCTRSWRPSAGLCSSQRCACKCAPASFANRICFC